VKNKFHFKAFRLKEPEAFWTWKGFCNFFYQFEFAGTFLVTGTSTSRYHDFVLVPKKPDIFWGKLFLEYFINLDPQIPIPSLLIRTEETARRIISGEEIEKFFFATKKKIKKLPANNQNVEAISDSIHLKSYKFVGVFTNGNDKIRYITPIEAGNYETLQPKFFDPAFNQQLELLKKTT